MCLEGGSQQVVFCICGFPGFLQNKLDILQVSFYSYLDSTLWALSAGGNGMVSVSDAGLSLSPATFPCALLPCLHSAELVQGLGPLQLPGAQGCPTYCRSRGIAGLGGRKLEPEPLGCSHTCSRIHSFTLPPSHWPAPGVPWRRARP